jgi:hypothetical protein
MLGRPDPPMGTAVLSSRYARQARVQPHCSHPQRCHDHNASRHPQRSPPLGQLLDRELSCGPLHADSVILLPTDPGQTAAPILHLEFQTRPDPWMAERMLSTGSVCTAASTSGCQLLAGLTFSQDVIQRLLGMSILEDSGDALLGFQGPADLKRRLRRIKPA